MAQRALLLVEQSAFATERAARDCRYLEWLWRTLMYGAPPPMRLSKAAALMRALLEAHLIMALGVALGVVLGVVLGGRRKFLSPRDRLLEILFGLDRLHRTRLSYFFGRIDFAACGAEISEVQLALAKS